MTTPESQPEPEPRSTSWLPTDSEPSPATKIHWHILFDGGAEAAPDALTEGFIERCCQAALIEQNRLNLVDVSDLEMSVQLLDSQAMRELNLQYRQIDKPTNVLSFAAELPLMVTDAQAMREASGGGLLILGDLVLCPQIIAREASEQSKLPLQHWAHMLVHGTLHLCGYDHENEQEAQEMEAIEIRILSGQGMPDPYAVSNAVNEQ